jgi:hypothetical protein
MTHLSDELLSAHIDGDDLWSPDAAHLETCDECRFRLEALRGVVAAVRTPPAAPAAHLRDAAVAAAMVETTGVGPNIRRLVTRRDRAVQSGVARRMSAASAAAALLVALGVGGWAISQVGKSSGRDASTTANALRTESATAADAASGAKAAPSAATEESADSIGGWYEAGDIGAYNDAGEVAARYRAWAERPEEERFADGTIVTTDPCPNPPNQPTFWHASLTYDGEPAYARMLFVTPEQSLLQVLRRANCEVVASQTL